MNINNLPENSDSSDEDYIPETSNTNLPSEEESDGEIEDQLETSEELSSTRNKRHRKVAKPRKKLKTNSSPPIQKTVDTQSTEDLWADFKKDTGFKTRAERQSTEVVSPCNKSTETIPKNKSDKIDVVEIPKTAKVTEVYKFAGEEIIVEKDINVASASKTPIAKGAKSGINSILSNLGKKTKISTLEKSKLDWDRFKKDEQIEDELQAYGKSKDGYLEKQDFLQRADMRRFEIEKDLRSSLRSNRMNNV